MSKELKNKVLERIEKEDIKPTSQWYYEAKNLFFWMLVILFIVLVALSLSVILLYATELPGLRQIPMSDFIFISFFIWLILFAVFLMGDYVFIRKTKGGYHWEVKLVLFTLLFVGLLLGIISYFIGANEKIDFALEKKIGKHCCFLPTKEDLWNNPQNGLLAGEIVGKSDKLIILKSFEEDDWEVNYGENTIIRGRAGLIEGERIKIIGERIADKKFEAKEIRPWGGGWGGRFRMGSGSAGRSRMMP